MNLVHDCLFAHFKLISVSKEHCETTGMHALSIHLFRRVIKNSFDLKFRKRGDCQKFQELDDLMRPKIPSAERKEMLSKKKDSHLDPVRKFKMALRSTIEQSLGIEKHVEVLTSALQRLFETPSPKNANDVYFRKPLWTFSFCIYDEIRD